MAVDGGPESFRRSGDGRDSHQETTAPCPKEREGERDGQMEREGERDGRMERDGGIEKEWRDKGRNIERKRERVMAWGGKQRERVD